MDELNAENNSSGIAAIAVVVTILAASLAKAESEGKPVSGGTITWGLTTEPVCFDPHSASQQAAFFVARNYIDSLVGKKADGTFAPWLAAEWSISADGKEYTYKLREAPPTRTAVGEHPR
jgi:peptide/nickel transport system substrate-binding protein